MNNQENPSRIELLIAHLLRWGVGISFGIAALGIFLVLITMQTGYQSIRLDDLNAIIRYHVGPPDYPNTLDDILGGVLALKPYALIVLGLLLLIATPVMRVAVSVVAFLAERDWVYVAITAFVLLMLIASFVFGVAGG